MEKIKSQLSTVQKQKQSLGLESGKTDVQFNIETNPDEMGPATAAISKLTSVKKDKIANENIPTLNSHGSRPDSSSTSKDRHMNSVLNTIEDQYNKEGTGVRSLAMRTPAVLEPAEQIEARLSGQENESPPISQLKEKLSHRSINKSQSPDLNETLN